jgi:DNA polymerase III delta prime subunit
MSHSYGDNMQVENSLWCEAYRPQNLDTYVGNEQIKTKIQSLIDSQDIPHLLLAGRAGTGKTTLAKLLVNNIECDSLFINASDENSIDTIRNKIKGFVTTMGFTSLKIVILDEADYITPNGQAALRNLMETFSKHARFILTCNFQERIIDPIISRCQSFSLVPPSQKDVAVHLANILKEESVTFSPEDIKQLVVTYYPDIRKIINTAQLFSKNGELTIDTQQLVGSDVKLKVLELLLQKLNPNERFKEIRELLHTNSITDYSDIFTYLYENIEEFPEDKQPMIILELAEAQHKDAFVVDKEINFAACVYKIIKL